MTTSIQHNSHAAPAPLLLTHGFKSGQTVRAHYFVDPQFKNEIYKCEVLGVKETWIGISLLVLPCANRFNLLSRWITVHQVVSADTPLSGEELYQDMVATQVVSNEYALLDTFDLPADHATYQKKVRAHITALRAAAAYTGCSAEAVIEYLYGKGKTVQAAPIAPQGALPRLEASTEAIVTAPVIEAVDVVSRKAGVVSHWHYLGQWGYLRIDGQDEGIRMTRKNILGMGENNIRLMCGDKVEFTLSRGNTAMNVVMTDVAASREAYTAKMAQRRPATPLARRAARSDWQQSGQATFKTDAAELANARAIVEALNPAQ